MPLITPNISVPEKRQSFRNSKFQHAFDLRIRNAKNVILNYIAFDLGLYKITRCLGYIIFLNGRRILLSVLVLALCIAAMLFIAVPEAMGETAHYGEDIVYDAMAANISVGFGIAMIISMIIACSFVLASKADQIHWARDLEERDDDVLEEIYQVLHNRKDLLLAAVFFVLAGITAAIALFGEPIAHLFSWEGQEPFLDISSTSLVVFGFFSVSSVFAIGCLAIAIERTGNARLKDVLLGVARKNDFIIAPSQEAEKYKEHAYITFPDERIIVDPERSPFSS